MLVGRKRERELLERAYNSAESQFITVYGRRRVGKTYLIREFFNQKRCIFFHLTGMQNGRLEEQLENFGKAFSIAFYRGAPIKSPATWREAFDLLDQQIQGTKRKVVLFFDELPWLVTRKSGLMDLIDFYWNNRWSGEGRVLFIACGSSASWLLKNIIYHRGGLHNRTTVELKLLPFNLAETRDYLRQLKVTLDDSHIVSLYMALGGIPYYLGYVTPGKSAQQIIQLLFFEENGPLKNEYQKLFDSLFDGADAYKELIKLCAQKKGGIERSELEKKVQLAGSGGGLSRRLQALCDSGFIKEYLSWKKTIGVTYKVVDEFCLFYLRWVEDSEGIAFAQDHWMIQSQRPRYYAWAGYAFEAVCSKHIHQIIRALGITTVSTIGSWRFVSKNEDEQGAEIDLVFDRVDNAVTLCEIKYTEKPFTVDKSYAGVLMNKITAFKKSTKTDKQIFLALVSAQGLKTTIYSEELISGVVVLEDLFKEYGSF